MKTFFNSYDLLLFDFDGLLVDTERLHHLAYIEMCARRGAKLDWDFEKFASVAHIDATSIRETIRKEHPQLMEQASWETLYNEKKQIYLEMVEKGDIHLMPGVEPFIQAAAAAKLKLCVVTNSTRAQIETIKNQIPVLQIIPNWITREDYREPKPAPDGYLEAVRRLASPGDRIVGFEDSLRGYQALQSAQVKAFLITPIHQPIPYFHSFDELIKNFD